MNDYFEELYRTHRIQSKRYNKDGEMPYGSWQFESWGCADCHSTTMDSIYAAYAESKICEEW